MPSSLSHFWIGVHKHIENKCRQIQFSLNALLVLFYVSVSFLLYLCSSSLIFLICMSLPWNVQTLSRLDPKNVIPRWDPTHKQISTNYKSKECPQIAVWPKTDIAQLFYNQPAWCFNQYLKITLISAVLGCVPMKTSQE